MSSYGVFISHSWSYTDDYAGLVGLLNQQVLSRYDFIYKNFYRHSEILAQSIIEVLIKNSLMQFIHTQIIV